MWLLMTAALANNPVEVVEGPRPARDVWTAASARKGPLGACFGGTDAEVLLVVTIQPDGLVSDSKFRSNDNPDPSVTRCLMSEALRMRVPRRDDSEGPSTFRWTVSPATLNTTAVKAVPDPGTYEVRGALDHEQVKEVISRFQNHFRYCYDKEVPRDQTLAGSFDLHVTVDADGKVQDAAVKNLEMPHDRVANCIATKFRSIQFDDPSDGKPVLIAYPFTFPLEK